jgi:hypothetical protein
MRRWLVLASVLLAISALIATSDSAAYASPLTINTAQKGNRVQNFEQRMRCPDEGNPGGVL